MKGQPRETIPGRAAQLSEESITEDPFTILGGSDLKAALAVGEAAISLRERQVLVLIASGKSSKQIAARLGIAFKTVVAHRYHIQKKLNAHNTAALTLAAIRMGLVDL